jgi:hypothetical protein
MSSAVPPASALLPGAPVSLGIPGLPETIQHPSAGQVYALAVEGQALRLPLLAQALWDTLGNGGTCTMLMPGDPASFVAKSRLCGLDLQAHLAAGELNLVRQRADPLLPVYRAGPAAVFEMIARSVPAGRHLLVLDQAEPMLFLADASAALDAAQRLRDWAQQTGTAVLLVVSPAGRPAREGLALRIVSEDFAGFASVRERERGARLDVHHWFGAAGASPRLALPLQATPSGQWVAEPAAPHPRPGAEQATIQVVALEAALDDPLAAVRDAGWAVVSTAPQAVEAARTLSAGAVVLMADRETSWRTLGHAVAAVRRQSTAWVAIVVRERGMRLRLGQQVALARLGMSAVVPDSADDADLGVALRGLAGCAFTRTVPDDVDATLAAVTAAPAPQLMVTRSFRDLVADALTISADDDLSHTLLHVACDPAKAQQLGTVALQRRIRDCALAVDPTGLWMFLFGCPASRAPRVAERVFGRHHAEIAAAISVAGTPGAIARRVEGMSGPLGTPPDGALRERPRIAAR